MMRSTVRKAIIVAAVVVALGAGSVAAQEVTLDISADNGAFDRSELSAPAGSEVTIIFENREAVPHNVSVYESAEMATEIYVGEVITGPKTIEYTFTAPEKPGEYFFVCDVHPRTMTGSFVATEQ